jgi:hypothetical protein
MLILGSRRANAALQHVAVVAQKFVQIDRARC